MKESRFRITHVFLSLFLIAFACVIGYWVFTSWSFFDFTPLFLLYIPFLCTGVVLPLFCGIFIIINDIKKIKSNESTSLYEDEK